MRKCLIYNSSLKFARATYGCLALIAFFLHNIWLVLLTGILTIIGAVSEKYNLPYQFHAKFLRKVFKDKSEPLEKDKGELSFACGMASIFLFLAFILLYFGRFLSIAWGLVLIVAILMLFAGIAGICMASLMYAFGKKIFKRS
jgi:uncharacterized membrane protein YedE/YeeE